MSASISTIPASFYVNVIPGVIGAGQPGINLIELMLTNSPRMPVGAVLAFPSLAAVQAYFGVLSKEANAAAVYFLGYNLATASPGSLLFTQYNQANVGAWLRGGTVASMTLTQLQAISGILTVTIDGTPHTSSSITLGSATSFSDAAEKISTALGVIGPTQAVVTASSGASFTATGTGTSLVVTAVTGVIHPGNLQSALLAGTGVPGSTYIVSQSSGTTGGAGTYLTNNATTSSAAALTTVSNVLDVTAVASGAIAVGQQPVGTNLDTLYISTFLTGTGGVGTYTLTARNTAVVASESVNMDLPVVTFDAISSAFMINSPTIGASSTMSFASGTIAAPLNLTLVTGAVVSQGAVAAVPASFMAAIIAQNTGWATFQTLFDPDNGSGNTVKQAFAAWVNTTQDRYMYICEDTDITPTESTDAPTCMGQILKANGSDGTALIYEPAGSDLNIGAFLGGFVASINFNATNGRATADYKSQSGLQPSVSNIEVAANLLANGYNYYGQVATGGGQWQFFDDGQVSGTFLWIDTYVNQIWLNNQCQIALMNLLTTLGRIPYTPVGYGFIRQTLTGGADGANITLPPASPVAAGLNNGVITPGVPLSAVQALEVNTLAGLKIDQTLTAQGWYLIIQPATAQVRAARKSPTIILLYTDGGSIQRIDLSSIVVQ